MFLVINFTGLAERDDQKGKSGSGGIGILIRKECGNSSLIKEYDVFEGLWIKCICGDVSLFICAVYISPKYSSDDFSKCMGVLEDDCIKFRSLGKAVVMGDFNARIGMMH